MNKVFANIDQAVADITSGSTVLVGGFAGCGTPYNLIDTLIEQGASELTIVCNASAEWNLFVQHGCAKKLITGFARNPYDADINKMIDKAIKSGKLEVEIVPHGTLEERIRAGGAGIKAFYVRIGVGTVVEEGKEKRIFDGEEYILEYALKGDFALIKGYQGDRFGNIVCRFSAGNRNIVMATAAKITIAEVEHIMDVGELDPNRVDIPGIFVTRVVQAPKVSRWLYKTKA